MNNKLFIPIYMDERYLAPFFLWWIFLYEKKHKVSNFVEDHLMNIPMTFDSNWPIGFRED
jgi:hypothetical protein